MLMAGTTASVFPMFATAGSKTQTYGDFEYTPYNSYAEINAYNGTEPVVEIPAEINGLKVTGIADSGLSQNAYIEKLVLPEGITTIGEHAISNNKNMKEIIFPASLDTIEFGAIGYNKSLTEVYLPEGLETISDYSFYTCYELTDIYIPSTVSSIGVSFASSCFKTENFHVDDANDYYCDVDGVLYSKDMSTLVRYPSNKAAVKYSIPNSVTEIAPSAFMTVQNLEEMNIPDSVVQLGERSFEMCSALKSLKLPQGITEIPQYCITSLYKLEELYIPKTVTNISKHSCVFYDTPTTVYYEGSEEDWNAIPIDDGNTGLDNATFVFNYDYSTDKPMIGDVNADGTFNIADVLLLQKWLLNVPDTKLSSWKAADLYEDGQINGFDLCLMKRELINKMNTEVSPQKNDSLK